MCKNHAKTYDFECFCMIFDDFWYFFKNFRAGGPKIFEKVPKIMKNHPKTFKIICFGMIFAHFSEPSNDFPVISLRSGKHVFGRFRVFGRIRRIRRAVGPSAAQGCVN